MNAGSTKYQSTHTHLEEEVGDLAIWLQREFASRFRRNPKYSLRSFARLLKMDASSVSQLLSGKRRASPKLIIRLCEALDASLWEKQRLLKFAGERARSKDPTLTDNSPSFHQLSLDAFSVISDWHHFALLELTFTTGFKSNPSWIAGILGVPVTEIKSAIARLKRLGLIEVREGRLAKTNTYITNGVAGVDTSTGHKQLQRQVLQRALDAIDNTPPEEKDITSMTLAIDVDRIPEARKIIKKFRRDICQFLENGKRTRVYNLGVQLYPISKCTLSKE